MDLHLFDSVEQAQNLTTAWLWVYNNERPHFALGGIPPKGLDDAISYSSKSEEVDFVSLSKSVTVEKSPKTILNELIRLGQAQLIDNQVRLTLFEHTPEQSDHKTLLNDFTDNLAWHTLAGYHLLMVVKNQHYWNKRLKLMVSFEQSAQDLSKLGKEYWEEASKKMIDKALPISEKEEKQGGKHKLTFGVYCYYNKN